MRKTRWLRYVQVALLIITMAVGVMWYSRVHLPYDEEGRYFDKEEMVTYSEQTVDVLKVLFMVSFSFWIISLVGAARHSGDGT